MEIVCEHNVNILSTFKFMWRTWQTVYYSSISYGATSQHDPFGVSGRLATVKSSIHSLLVLFLVLYQLLKEMSGSLVLHCGANCVCVSFGAEQVVCRTKTVKLWGGQPNNDLKLMLLC